MSTKKVLKLTSNDGFYLPLFNLKGLKASITPLGYNNDSRSGNPVSIVLLELKYFLELSQVINILSTNLEIKRLANPVTEVCSCVTDGIRKIQAAKTTGTAKYPPKLNTKSGLNLIKNNSD